MISRTLITLTALTLACAPARAAFQTMAGGTAATSGSYYYGGIYEPITLSQSNAQDPVWTASSSGSVSLFAAGTQTTHQVIRPTNAVIDQPITWYSQAQTAGNGYAEPGRLHAFASASALMNPTTQSLDYEDNVTHEIKQYTAINPVHAVAHTQIQVGWQDTLTITSDTLPPGALVDVRLTSVLDAIITNPNHTPNTGVSSYFYATVGSNTTNLLTYASADPNTSSKTRLWTFRVGDTVTLKATMTLAAYARAGYNIDPLTSGVTIPNDAVTVDASNTGHYYFDIVPGFDAVVTSSTGYDYSVSAPTPEPASLSLLVVGALALTSRRRRPTVPAA
jgi:hypothetical protein